MASTAAEDSAMVENDQPMEASSEMTETAAREEVASAQPVESIEVESDDENLVKAYVRRARANYDAGDYTRAMTEIDFALELDPTDRSALALRGELLAIFGIRARHGPHFGSENIRSVGLPAESKLSNDMIFPRRSER